MLVTFGLYAQNTIVLSGDKERATTMANGMNYQIKKPENGFDMRSKVIVGDTMPYGRDGKEIRIEYQNIHVGDVFVSNTMQNKMHNPYSDISVSEIVDTYCDVQRRVILLVLSMLPKKATKELSEDVTLPLLADSADRYELPNQKTPPPMTPCEIAATEWARIEVLEKIGRTPTARKARRIGLRNGLPYQESWGLTRQEAEDAFATLALEYPVCLNDRLEVKRKNGWIIPVAVVATVIGLDLLEDGKINLFNLFKKHRDNPEVVINEPIKPNDSGNESGNGGGFNPNGSGNFNGGNGTGNRVNTFNSFQTQLTSMSNTVNKAYKRKRS